LSDGANAREVPAKQKKLSYTYLDNLLFFMKNMGGYHGIKTFNNGQNRTWNDKEEKNSGFVE